MRKLIFTNRFKKAYARYLRKYPQFEEKLYKTIILMEEDIFHPVLKTHKLSGRLFGILASSYGYDCRIIFTIEINPSTHKEEIVLLNIGSHEVVY